MSVTSGIVAYLDEMATLTRADRLTVRWHRFSESAIVAGPATIGYVDVEAAAASGLPIHERQAGGGPVLLTPDLLALAVAIPNGHPLWQDDLTQSYAWLGDALAAACLDVAIPARTLSVAEARADDPQLGRLACFAGCSPYEVFNDDRKLWGLAQRRTRATALFVAGIYLAGDPTALADLLRARPPIAADRLETVRERLRAVATLASVGPGCSPIDLVAAVERRLGEAIGGA